MSRSAEMIALASAQSDDDDSTAEAEEDALMSMPMCMPNPDGMMKVVESFLGHADPITATAHMCAKVLLTLHALTAAVHIGAAFGGE